MTASLSAHSEATKNRVQRALDVGYEVTIHEALITQDEWAGAGFTLIDPAIGAGGYLIEGGANGRWLVLNGFVVLALIAAILLTSVLAISGLIGLAAYSIGAAIVTSAFID
ncbi:hypothetical protein [Variovorax terrae]|uniref:Uncharacterized protein n=1 Tax=Variovorax terrae TaxID=2923278 RepID=A0A9X2API3_9BURK|nr:hypothetical protein [Variovorax terrae]MCJ0763537.1 hypothetical protein [Variovorax terrae]